MNTAAAILLACCFIMIPIYLSVNSNYIKDNLSRQYLNPSNTVFYEKDAFPKDTVPANMIGNTEKYPVSDDVNLPFGAWTDANITNNPDYYTSDFTDNVLDTTLFFDKNNRFSEPGIDNVYVDTAKYKYPNNYCKLSNKLTNECNFNGRLYMAPITNYQYGYDGRSVLKEPIAESVQNINENAHSVLIYKDEKVSNGSPFFSDVTGFETSSDTNSPILKQPVYTCS